MTKWCCVLIVASTIGLSSCSPSVPSDATVSITPTAASVAITQTQQFTAAVTGTSNTAVTWQISCATGVSACGSLSASGLYTAPPSVPSPPTVTVTATSKENTSKSASATVTIVSSNASITVVPASTTLGPGQAVTLTANETNTTGSVTWQVTCAAGGSSCGAVTPTGVSPPTARYRAPTGISTQISVTVSAVLQSSPSIQGTATVTVTGNSSGISITINSSGASPTVQTYRTMQFTATVTGTTNTSVNWQVSCDAGGINGAACGAISPAGLYTAPNSVPTTQAGGGGAVTDVVTVTAISQANAAATGSIIVTVTSLNQEAQSLPISLGASGSNANAICTSPAPGFCYGGTLGSLISQGGKQYILSNNHVLGMTDTATQGQNVTEPGLIDTGCSTAGTNTVANFTEYISLNPAPTVPVDVAIAQVGTGTVNPNGNVLELGATCSNGGTCSAGMTPDPGAPAAGTGIAATLNEALAKSGRSTGLTCASVESISTRVEITYTTGCTTNSFNVIYGDAVMVGQTSTGDSFSAAGDSGSLMVDQQTAQPVALLFAGDNTSTVGNPVADVLNAIGSSATFVGGSPHTVNACTLPQPTSGVTVLATRASAAVPAAASLSAQLLQKASSARDNHSVELLANPGVAALGVGASLDSPKEPAVLVFVQRGVARNPIPPEIDGVRTRIIARDTFPVRGSLTQAQSEQLAQTALLVSVPVPTAAVRSAIATKETYAAQLMADPAVQGVGVSASLDSPGDAALMIYVLAGKPHNAIPITIGGLRTRIKETTGFRAGFGRSAIGKGCQGAAAQSPAITTKASAATRH